MSINDDLCDFCGTFIDPIGGDGARARGYKLWCGRCTATDDQGVDGFRWWTGKADPREIEQRRQAIIDASRRVYIYWKEEEKGFEDLNERHAWDVKFDAAVDALCQAVESYDEPV